MNRESWRGRTRETIPKPHVQLRGHKSADGAFTPEEIEIINQSTEDFNTRVLKHGKRRA